MPLLVRYTLLQIPGWLFLASLLWWAISSGWIQISTAAWIMAGWILKDASLYPLYKPALEGSPAIGTKALLGREAIVIMPLAPRGLVRLDGERWLAQASDNQEIAVGQRIRVTGTNGLVLIVEPAA